MASARHIIVACFALAVVAGAAAAVAWRPAIAAIEPATPTSFDAALIKRGRELAALGNCTDCHTVKGGQAFAGGLPVPTPFGTIFSANITPDLETGIGRWSEAAFRRAMRTGVNRAGQHLYPTFPYDHFTNVSDDDDRALYAFLMTRQPAHATPPANQLAFPLDQRVVVAGWKLLFLHGETYRADPGQNAEWNRGAYLVDGLAHCSACHSPRNALGAEKVTAQFSGGDVDDWQAYPINDTSKAPVAWTSEALFAYLRTGWHPSHGLARGPMAQVVSNLSSVPESDVRAIATYMASVSGAVTPDRQRRGDEALAKAVAPSDANAARAMATATAGAAIYQAACANCHEAARALPYGGVNLHLSTGISASDARNVSNTILMGLRPVEGERSSIMPAFGSTINDAQMVALLTYLRARFSDQPAWTDLADTVQAARNSQRVVVQTAPGPRNFPAEPTQRDKP